MELVPKAERVRDALGEAVLEIEQETGAELFGAVQAFQSELQTRDWGSRVKEKFK